MLESNQINVYPYNLSDFESFEKCVEYFKSYRLYSLMFQNLLLVVKR